jgi:TonB family protein
MTAPRSTITTVRSTSSCVFRLCSLFGVYALAAILNLPHIAASQKKGSDGCGKDEIKTDQGCRKHPRVLKKTLPEYPAEARARHVEGSVTLQGRITEQGTVEEVKVVKSEATEGGFVESFKNSAIAAFRQWRYQPATIDGKPVPTDWTVVLDFRLSGQ